ncbi:MAG TPA: hypothetical protein P5262_04085 [Candidatus Moranbacteria bacterium]|nr:hypothetical protein [Candidatus Moranbacteria bacterium]
MKKDQIKWQRERICDREHPCPHCGNPFKFTDTGKCSNCSEKSEQ